MSGIKVITEPSVYLVGCSAVNPGGRGRFLDDHGFDGWSTDAPGAGEHLIEAAGRLCYMSFSKPRPGGNKAYLEHILESGHGSVLEHATFSFIIAGIPRSLTHQWIRHRAGWAYSEQSQRFCDSSEVAFIVPPEIDEEFGTFQDWFEACRMAAVSYRRLAAKLSKKFAHIEDKTSRRKRAREAARSVLPECAETRIFATANVRALRHFVELRGSLHADAEIRRLALAILKVLKSEAPNLFPDFEVDVSEDGREFVKCLYHKV